jgi:hypothetical protein
MRSSLQCLRHEAANQCAVCSRKFGLVRHYAWQTALCSSKCRDQFRAREAGDRLWLSPGSQENCVPIQT